VDLSESGTFNSRHGFTSVVAGTRIRSGFSVDDFGALVANGSDLSKFDGSTLTKIADLGSPYGRVSYADTQNGIVWSDGLKIGVVRNWTNTSLAPNTPNPLPQVQVITGGSFPEGNYQISYAAQMADGRRSPMSFPVEIYIPVNGRLSITMPAQPYPVHVFLTPPNGSTFFRVGSFSSGSLIVGSSNTSGEGVRFEVEEVIPPCRVLGFHNGRILAAIGGLLIYSKAYSSLYRPASDFIPFPSDIRLIASVASGVFIATEKATHFIAVDINEGTLTDVATFGATDGTLVSLPNSTDLMWFTPRGQVRVTQDGSFTLLQDKQIQFPNSAVGAAMFRETDGARQYVATLANPVPSGSAVARSFFELE